MCFCVHWVHVNTCPLLTLFLLVKDVHLTGITQAGFHMWLEREKKREGEGEEECRGGWNGGDTEWEWSKGAWPCWCETDVKDWWGLEQQTHKCNNKTNSCSHCLTNIYICAQWEKRIIFVWWRKISRCFTWEAVTQQLVWAFFLSIWIYGHNSQAEISTTAWQIISVPWTEWLILVKRLNSFTIEE